VDGNLFHSIGPLTVKLRFPYSLVLILGTSSWPWADERRDALPGTETSFGFFRALSLPWKPVVSASIMSPNLRLDRGQT